MRPLLLCMLLMCGQSRKMVFDPPATTGSMDFATQANWNLPLPLTSRDDVTIRITACTGQPNDASASAVLNAPVSINSLTLDSQVSLNGVGTMTSCPSTLLINPGITLTVASRVAVLPQSKLALNGGSLVCSNFQLQGFAALGGTGTITASASVDLWARSLVVPGLYYWASCPSCWPSWGNRPSAFGDLKFVTPTTNAEAGSAFHFKDVVAFAEMANRPNAGQPYDTVTFTGLLNTSGASITIVHANNTVQPERALSKLAAPLLWGASAKLLSWGQINVMQAFSTDLSGSNAKWLMGCGLGFNTRFATGFSCHPQPVLMCGPGAACSLVGCPQVGGSGLSLISGASTCSILQQPNSPIASPVSTAGTGGLLLFCVSFLARSLSLSLSLLSLSLSLSLTAYCTETNSGSTPADRGGGLSTGAIVG
jgi:hypothetical protein